MVDNSLRNLIRVTPATAGIRLMHWLCLSHSGTDIDDDGNENEMHTSTPHHHPPPSATTQQPALSDPTSAHGLSQQALSITSKPPNPNHIQIHPGHHDQTRFTGIVLAPKAQPHPNTSRAPRPYTFHRYSLGSRAYRAPPRVFVHVSCLGSRAQTASDTLSTCNVRCLLGWLV